MEEKMVDRDTSGVTIVKQTATRIASFHPCVRPGVTVSYITLSAVSLLLPVARDSPNPPLPLAPCPVFLSARHNLLSVSPDSVLCQVSVRPVPRRLPDEPASESVQGEGNDVIPCGEPPGVFAWFGGGSCDFAFFSV